MFPDSVERQFQIALENTITLLNSENINTDGIVKVNIGLTEKAF